MTEVQISATNATRKCPRCKRELPVDAFSISAKNGRQCYCRECNTAYARQWIAKNRDKTFANKLWSLYRMRPDDLAAMRGAQDDGCKLCRRKFDGDWHIDHDHRCCPGERCCGKCVRGLLCPRCNSLVGWIEGQWPSLNLFVGEVEQYLDCRPSLTQVGRVPDF